MKTNEIVKEATLKLYARYLSRDGMARHVGHDFHEVTRTFRQWMPSGNREFVVINGIAVKSDYCEIVQVFEVK